MRANLILQIFMLSGYGFDTIELEDILSLQVFSVILTSLSIDLSSWDKLLIKLKLSLLAFSCLALSVTVPWSLWAVNLWPVISLAVSQARQLSILHQFRYVSQTGPTVTTDVNNSVQVENWKSRPPDNTSLGCGIWQRLSSLLAFFPVLFPRVFPIFLTPKPLRRRVLQTTNTSNNFKTIPCFKAIMHSSKFFGIYPRNHERNRTFFKNFLG